MSLKIFEKIDKCKGKLRFFFTDSLSVFIKIKEGKSFALFVLCHFYILSAEISKSIDDKPYRIYQNDRTAQSQKSKDLHV